MSTTRALIAAVLLGAAGSAADELPVALQAQLLSKMSTYIVNFAAGETDAAKVMIVYPGPGDSPSRGAQALSAAIEKIEKIGALKVAPKLVPYDPKKFAGVLAAEKPHLVYLAPELDERSVDGIVDALGKVPAVSVTGVSDHVKRGVILGFSLVEARPRVFLNLKQAAKQNVAFHGGLVSHSVVVDR